MPLEFIFSSRTNRSYGGGPTSTLCNILEAEKVGFGSAIEAIFVEFLHPGRVSEERVAASQKKSGWESFLGFQELDPLHGDYSVRFERKRKRLVIKYTSKTISADDAFHTDELITRDLFFRGFDETIKAIDWGLKKRLKADDDFNIPQFLKWLNVMRSVEYASDEALVKAWVHARKYVDAKYAARNAWDQLDLDWDTFHRDARFLLDDAGDWSNTDDFSPHGNDTGADIFAEWADYARVEISEAARIFGIPPYDDDQPDFLWKTWVELHLALAFGHIKMSGTCPAKIAEATRDVLAREFALNKERRDWAHAQDWSKRLARYDQILIGFDLR